MELFAGPLLSVILVLLAGIALRYALWMGRDESAQRAGDTINEYEQRVRSLHEALDSEKASQQKLRVDLDQRSHDIHSMKNQSERWQSSFKSEEQKSADLERRLANEQTRSESLEEAIAGLQSQLESLNREIADKEASLRDMLDDRHAQEERQQAIATEKDDAIQRLQLQCTELEDKRSRTDALLAEARKEFSESQAETEQLKSVVSNSAARIDSLLENNARLQEENDTLREKAIELDATREEIGEDRIESQRMQENIERLEAEKLLLEESQATLQQRIEYQQAELEQTREQSLESQRALASLSNTIESLERQLQESHEDNDDLVSRAEQAARLAGQLAEAQKTIEQHETVISGFDQEMDVQNAAFGKLHADHEAAELRIASLSRELEFANDRIRALKTELEVLQQEHSGLTSTQQTLESEYTAAQSQVQEYQEAMRQLESEREELLRALVREKESRASVHEEITKLHETETELISLTQVLAANELEMEKLRAEIQYSRDQYGQLADDKEDILASWEAEQAIRHDLEEKLRLQAETIEQMRRDASSLDDLLVRQRMIQDSIDRNASRLAIGSTSDERGEHSQEILSFSEASSNREASVDPVLGSLYPQRPSRVDDLKRISGIGNVLEDKLNALGIYRYEQIMNWSAEAIDRFSELLSFKDRIDRDQWVAQASRLYEETKYRAA